MALVMLAFIFVRRQDAIDAAEGSSWTHWNENHLTCQARAGRGSIRRVEFRSDTARAGVGSRALIAALLP